MTLNTMPFELLYFCHEECFFGRFGGWSFGRL